VSDGINPFAGSLRLSVRLRGRKTYGNVWCEDVPTVPLLTKEGLGEVTHYQPDTALWVYPSLRLSFLTAEWDTPC
jgi:hypothetical protein